MSTPMTTTTPLRDEVTPADFGIPAEHCEKAEHYARWLLAKSLSARAEPHAGGPQRTFDSPEALAEWLDGLYEMDGGDGPLTDRKWDVAQRARRAILAPSPATPPAASGDDEVLICALIGIAKHLRAVPAYRKLRGDADVIDEAIRRLAAVAPAGMVLTGHVSGYLPRQQAIEIKADAPLPAWLTSQQFLRVTLAAAPSPASRARPEAQGEACETCGGRGEVGGNLGQTPESFDLRTEPCPDCSPPADRAPGEVGEDDAKLVDALADHAYSDAADGRSCPSDATEQAREALIRRLAARAPSAPGGEVTEDARRWAFYVHAMTDESGIAREAIRRQAFPAHTKEAWDACIDKAMAEVVLPEAANEAALAARTGKLGQQGEG